MTADRADRTDPVEIGDSLADHGALGCCASHFASVNAEVRAMADGGTAREALFT